MISHLFRSLKTNRIKKNNAVYECAILEGKIERDSAILQFAQNNLKTINMCQIAVKIDPLMIEFVPDDMKTSQMCHDAVKIISRLLEFVPNNIKTYKMCKHAVKQDSTLFVFVPDALKTVEMCKQVIKCNLFLFLYVPDNMKTANICHFAVESDVKNFENVPDDMKTLELLNIVRSKLFYNGFEISGKLFNRLYHRDKFVKLTNEAEIHNGFKFKTGLNVDCIPFKPSNSCRAGGIYFVHEDDKERWLNYCPRIGRMKYLRYCTIPNSARVYVEKDKFKTNELILSDRQQIFKCFDVWESGCLDDFAFSVK